MLRPLSVILLIFFNFSWCFGVSLEIGSGYRQDDFHWNISGGSYGPNILSELKWKDLKIWEIYSELKVNCPYQTYFRFRGDYGKICDGWNKDTDYLGNHRTDPFSLSYSKANRGEVFDFSFGLAYEKSFFCEELKLAPAFGFSNHEQHLRMIHGELVLDLFEPQAEGPLSNLHNNYRAQWYGPWLGFDFQWYPLKNIEIFGTYEYHWTFYRGSGHWNLRTDFLGDFLQEGCGYGSLVYLGSKYTFSSGWQLALLGKFQEMQLHHGTDTVFFINRLGQPTSANTCLNEVKWTTFSILGTIGYSY